MRFITKQLLKSMRFYGEFRWKTYEEALESKHFSLQRAIEAFTDDIFDASEVQKILCRESGPIKHLNEWDYKKLQILAAKNDARFVTAMKMFDESFDVVHFSPHVPLGLKKFSCTTRHDDEILELSLYEDELKISVLALSGIVVWYLKVIPNWKLPDMRYYFDNGWLSTRYEEYVLLDDGCVENNILFRVHNRKAYGINRKISELRLKEIRAENYDAGLHEEIFRLEQENKEVVPEEDVEMSICIRDAYSEQALLLENSDVSPAIIKLSKADRFCWHLKGICQTDDVLRFEYLDKNEKKIFLNLKTSAKQSPHCLPETLEKLKEETAFAKEIAGQARNDVTDRSRNWRIYFEDWCLTSDGMVEYVVDFHDFNCPDRKRVIGAFNRKLSIYVLDAWQEAPDA